MKQKYYGREEFLNRIKQPECPSISVLAEELDIPKTTLYAWKASERRHGGFGMSKKKSQRSPVNKFKLILQSNDLKGQDLISFCEKNGVSLEELSTWKDLALSAIDHSESGSVISKKSHDAQIEKLDKELRRKTDALAEAAAIIVLQKKISDLFGEEK